MIKPYWILFLVGGVIAALLFNFGKLESLTLLQVLLRTVLPGLFFGFFAGNILNQINWVDKGLPRTGEDQ